MFCFVFNRSESSTDENPIRKPESFSSQNPIEESTSTIPPTSPSYINFSSLAKPFERTDNIHRLQETISSTEKLPTISNSARVTNNSNKINVDLGRSKSAQNSKKIVSLTSGFSIRRNPNNTNNPYTLTVLTRPFEDYDKARRTYPENDSNRNKQTNRFNSNTENVKKSVAFQPQFNQNSQKITGTFTQRKDVSPEIVNEDDIPIYVRPNRVKTTSAPKILYTTPYPTTKGTTKYYIKSATRQTTPFSLNNAPPVGSTENNINTDVIIDSDLQNTKTLETSSILLNSTIKESSQEEPNDVTVKSWNQPVVSPYRTLDNLRTSYNNKDELIQGYSTSTSTRRPVEIVSDKARRGPSYYSYRVIDEDVPDQTTEIFSGKVKNVIKAFFNNFVSTPTPKRVTQFPSTTLKMTTTEKVINIGHQKKTYSYVQEKSQQVNNIKHVQVMTEPTVNSLVSPSDDPLGFINKNTPLYNEFSSSTLPSYSNKKTSYVVTSSPTTPMMLESTTINEFRHNVPEKQSHESKFASLITNKPDIENSRKFQKIITQEVSTESNKRDGIFYDSGDDELTTPLKMNLETTNTANEIASTTSTTKSTVTVKNDLTSTTKSLSFPTRASRVNPAIKLAATNPGGGRRSYQSTTKCSSDNSLQANPKCNEIKYQRYITRRPVV